MDVLILVMIVFSILFRIFSKLPRYANLAFWMIVYFLLWFWGVKNPDPQANFELLLVEVFIVFVGVICIALWELEALKPATSKIIPLQPPSRLGLGPFPLDDGNEGNRVSIVAR